MTASALFDINGDGEDRGFAATPSQTLTLRLRPPVDAAIATVLFQVWDPAGADPDLGIAANPPRASSGAPTLTLVGASSGQAVSPATVSGNVSVTLPASAGHSWLVRCLVNGGWRALPGGGVVLDPTLIAERGVFIPTGFGLRKVVSTERNEFTLEGWADAVNDMIAIGGAPAASFLPPGLGAVSRTIASRLANDVLVTDFMTPAQIADANNGTKLYDMQPAIQSAIDWLLFGSSNTGNVRGRLRLPAGILRIDRTIHLNYGVGYRTLIFQGEGILRGAELGQTGTAIVATFGDAPAIAVTAGIDMVIKDMAIVGINFQHIYDVIATGPSAMNHLDAQTWVDPTLPAIASSRYAPYAGIAIDPYAGPQPAVHYPDVPIPPSVAPWITGPIPQYNKPPSGNITIEDVSIYGFVVGIALQPCDYDGNGDYVHLTRVSVWWCAYGLSWGNSQARVTSVADSTFAYLHTVFTSGTHGKRMGMPQISVANTSFMVSIQIFEINTLGFGAGPIFSNCYCEAMYRIGVCNGSGNQYAGGFTFLNCQFGFSWWERYGVPTWILDMPGGHQVIFVSTFFYNTVATGGYLGFHCSGSGICDEPARQLQFIGCQTMAPNMGSSLAERCAQNGTLGITVSKGSTCLDRFSISNGYITDLDTNTIIGFQGLHTEQNVAPRKYCAPVFAKRLKSLSNGSDPGIPVAWGNGVNFVIATVVSTVGRVTTVTIAGITAASLAHRGGDVGDVLVHGQGATFIVTSRTGTTLVLDAMNGFDMNGNLFGPFVVGDPVYPINCRHYVPSRVIYADMVAGSPTLINVIDGAAIAVDLTEHFFVGDFIHVDEDVDRFIDPNNAALVSFDNTAKTLTFAGAFSFTRTRTRLGVFVRAAMPNAA